LILKVIVLPVVVPEVEEALSQLGTPAIE